MSRSLNYLHYLSFRLKVHQAKGDVWEDLFVSVMEQDDSSFTKIKANQGDGGNDGYRRDGGVYYACYGPHDSSSERTKKEVCDKAERDLLKLKTNWHSTTPIKRYHPVFNDRYDGITQELEILMVTLQSDHGLEEASVFRASHLEDKFMSLSPERRERVIGFVPDPDTLPDYTLDYTSLNSVVNHVLRNRKPLPLMQNLSTPDLDDKIRFNGLSQTIDNHLHNFSNDSATIEEFFQKNSEWSKQDLRNMFALFYEEEDQKISCSSLANDERKNDYVFQSIAQRATPKLPVDASLSYQRSIQEAVLSLMAFYFESCDIFKSPPPDWKQ